jgi:drug/metabolite transporter (DMT)-like permease
MRLKDWAAFLFLTFVWGASFFWIKIAVREVDPLTLVAWRLVFGLLGLLVFFPIRKPPIPREKRVWVSLAILGITSSAIPWTLISWAEMRIDSAIASVLNGTVPLFTIVVAYLFLRDDRITSDTVLGLLFGFAGVVVLAQRTPAGDVPQAAGGLNLIGKGAMLLSSFSYALGAVHARRNLRGTSALIQAFVSMVFSLIVVLIVIYAVRGGLPVPSRPDTWGALAWLGVLGAGVASFVFYGLLHSVGPTRASLVTYTLPVVGVALGVVLLRERLDWPLVAGTLLIVSGVWVVNRR